MLEVSDLRVHYGPVAAVKGVSLRVAAGETVTLLGANGAGKSSTLLAIAGALQTAAGRVRLGDDDITYFSPERRVRAGLTMVPETRDVFPDLSVDENLRLGGYTQRRQPQRQARTRARLLELFPVLAQRAAQAAGTLSGGEQQMLVIARAMMTEPRILLLDEPSLGLAPTVVDKIFTLIEELKRDGLTILLVEQNAAKAFEVADRVYVLRLGEVAAAGSVAEVTANYDLRALYLGARA